MLLSTIPQFIGANLNPATWSITLLDSNSNGLYDTAKFTANLTNIPDNVQDDKDKAKIIVTTEVVLNTTDVSQNLAAPVASVAYGIESPAIAATPILKLVAPSLSLSLTPNITQVEGKSKVSVSIRFTAADGAAFSPGYDIYLSAIIPDELHIVGGTMRISGTGYNPTLYGASVYNGNVTDAAEVALGFVLLEEAKYITVTFDSMVDANVLLGSSIKLDGNLKYCSAPATYGRRCKSTAASATLLVNPPVLSFIMYNTSLSETKGYDLAIGERVIYHASMTYPKGDASAANLQVALPKSTGQQLVLGSSVIHIGGNFNISVLPAGSIVATGDTVTVSLPSLSINPDGTAVNGDTITIEIVALLTKSEVNTNGVKGTTTASFTYTSLTTSSIEITVVLPSLSITKTYTAPSYVDAYTNVDYKITIAHDGSSKAPAYNTIVQDVLPTELVLSGQVSSSVNGALIETSSVPQGTLIKVSVDLLDVGSTIEITYSTQVQVSAVASAFIVNQANVTYNSSYVFSYNINNIRSFANYVAARVEVAAPAISFRISSLVTSLVETQGVNVAIGELITITVDLTVPRGTTKNAKVLVTLPATNGKLRAIDGVVSSMPVTIQTTNYSSGQSAVVTKNSDTVADTIEFDLGIITNNPSGGASSNITFVVNMLVGNESRTVRNTRITPKASFLYYNGTNNLQKDSEFTVVVVEPDLAILNTVTSTTYIASGTVVNFTLTISNNPVSNGPSYYVDVQNPLSNHYSLITGSVHTTSGTVTKGNGGSDTVVIVAVGTMLPSTTVNITFAARLIDIVRPIETIPNQATLQYSSALVQEHNGADIRNKTKNANSSVTVSIPNLDFKLENSTIVDTVDPKLTIGESGTFIAELSLPHGTTNQAVLTVAVAQDVTKMNILRATITFLGSFMGSKYSVGDIISPQDLVSDGYNDTVKFDFGSVVNPSNGVAHTGPAIAARVEILAIVVDFRDNTNGADLDNTAEFTYGTAPVNGRLEDEVTLSIVLPSLQIDKRYELPSTYIESGSSIRYIVELSHGATSTSPAYDILIIDPMSSLMALQPSSVSWAISGTATFPQTGDTYLRILHTKLLWGQTLTITYNVTYQDTLPSSYLVSNKVNATYYSAPVDQYNTGNRRVDTVSDEALVRSADPELSFSLYNSSISQTPANNVTIGETVTLRAVVTIPHGKTLGSTLFTKMDSGLNIIYARIITMSDKVTSANSLAQNYGATPTDTNGDGYNDSANFVFGDLAFPYDGSFRSKDGQIVIELLALVVNDTTNVNLVTKTTTAQFKYSTFTLERTAPVRIVLPDLSLTKQANPPSYTEAGSIVSYTLTFRHTTRSNSPAFNLTAEDLLSSPYLKLVPQSVRISVGDVLIGNGVSDTTIFVVPPTILLTENIVVTYNATLTMPTITGSEVPNTATLWYASAIASAANNNGKHVRYFTTSGSAKVSVAKPEVLFFVKSGSLDADIPLNDVTIGETVVLVANITLPAGFTNAARLEFNLPNGQMEVLKGTVEYVPSNINSSISANTVIAPTQSNTLLVSFGTVNNIPDAYQRSQNDILTVSIIALVSNSSRNTNGANLNPSVKFSYYNGASTATVEDDVQLTVRLPVMTILKAAKAPTYLQAGDVVAYTVTLSHVGGSSTSPAYSISVSDLLASPSLVLVAGSVVSSKGGVVTGNVAGNEVIVVQPAKIPHTNSALVITYNATIAQVAETDSYIFNYVGAQYSSAPPDNIYNSDDIRVTVVNASASVYVASPVLSLALKNTSLPETVDNQVSISESIVFRAVITLPHGTTSNAVLSVSLPVSPGKLQLVSGTIVSMPTNAILTQAISTGTPSDSDSDGINDAITFNFGAIIFAPNGDRDGNDIVVEVEALTIDVPENVGGTVLSTTAKFTYGTNRQINSGKVDVIIVEPNLDAVQTCSPSTGESGDKISCIVTVKPLSSVPAYVVTFSNTFSEGTYSLVAGSVSTSSGSIISGNTDGATSFSVATSVFLSSTNFTVTFQATLTDIVESNTNVSTTTRLAYSSGPSFGSRTSSKNTTSSTLIYPPELLIDVTATSLEDTPGTNVSIGEVVTFVTTVDLAKGLTSDPTLVIFTGNALRILNAQVLSLGSSADCTAVSAGLIIDSDNDGIEDSVSFDFSPRLCRPASSSGGNVEVQVQALVSNISTNYRDAILFVKATLEYASGTVAASTSVVVVEPHLELSKSSSTNLVGGDQATNITYTVTLIHSQQSSHAYDIEVVDTVPASLQILTATVLSSVGTASVINNTITILIGELPVGTTFTLSYTTTLLPSVLAGGVIVNLATVHYASAPAASLPFLGAARIGEDSASAEILVGIPILTSFEVYNTSLSSRAPDLSSYPYTYYFAVGEVVTFRLASSVPGGLSDYIQLSQVIPLTTKEYNVITYNSVFGSTVESQSSIPTVLDNTVAFNFTQVSNELQGNNKEGFVILELQVVVGDVEANHFPSTVATTGHLESPLGNSNRKINLAIVEALLEISTSVTTPSPSFVEAGNIITYTTVISHTSSSTTTAYTLEIVDTLSPYVKLVAGSITTSVGTVSGGDTMTVSVDRLLLGENITITYQAEIITTSIASSAFNNNASVLFLSAPHSSLNFGFVRSTVVTASPAVLVIASPSIVFEVASTSISSPALPFVVIGATAVLEVHITLPLGTTPNTIVSVALASGTAGVLELVNASAISLTNTALLSSVELKDSDGDNINDTATFALGNLVNTAGAELGASPYITLSLSTFIPDVEGNVVGNSLVSTVVFTYNNETTTLTLPSASVELQIAGPQLDWTVTWNTTTGQAGDAVAGQLVVSHTAASTAPAYELDIAALLPFLEIIPDSALDPRGFGSLTYVDQLALGEFATIDFTGVLITEVVASSFLEFSMNNTYSSAVSRGRISKSRPLVTPFAIAPAPVANISLFNTSNPEVQGNIVLVGENATLYVTLEIPYGTILDPSLTLSVLPSTSSNNTLQFLSSTLLQIQNSTETFNTSVEMANLTSAFSFASLVNYPVVNSSKTVVFAYDVVVLPDPNITAGDVLTVESLFSFSNGSHTISQAVQNVSLVVAIAQFSFVQQCTSIVDVQGTAQCTITLTPIVAIPAYNLVIQNTISSLYNLRADTIISSHGTVSLTNSSATFQVDVPVYDPSLGANIIITYSTTFTAAAVDDTQVPIPVYATYLSSPTVYAAESALDTLATVQVNKGGGGGLGAGAIAGIVVGATVGAAAIAATAFVLMKRAAPPPANPFASTDTNMATTVEDNPLFEGNQFSSQSNPLYNNI